MLVLLSKLQQYERISLVIGYKRFQNGSIVSKITSLIETFLVTILYNKLKDDVAIFFHSLALVSQAIVRQ